VITFAGTIRCFSCGDVEANMILGTQWNHCPKELFLWIHYKMYMVTILNLSTTLLWNQCEECKLLKASLFSHQKCSPVSHTVRALRHCDLSSGDQNEDCGLPLTANCKIKIPCFLCRARLTFDLSIHVAILWNFR
jgi:hypothetical protein